MMNVVVEWLNTVGTRWIDFAWPMLLQSSLLIGLLFIVDFVLRKRVKAVFRYWLWMLVLAKLILPPSFSFPTGVGYWTQSNLAPILLPSSLANETKASLPMVEELQTLNPDIAQTEFSPAQPPVSNETRNLPEVAKIAKPSKPFHWLFCWQATLFTGYVLLMMVLILLMIRRLRFVRSLIAQAEPAGEQAVRILDQCRTQMRMKTKVCLKCSAESISPAACGIITPTILIPSALMKIMTNESLRGILLHELAHIRRGDLWVNWIQTLLQIVYFYNPLVWLANLAIRRTREKAVDETVLVALGDKALDYPETLVQVARMTLESSALHLRLIGIAESRNALNSRIRHILAHPFPTSAKLGILGTITILISAAFLLPMARGEKSLQEQEAKSISTHPATSEQAKNTLPAIQASGIVVDEQDRPRELVRLSASGQNVWNGVTTDVLGRFELKNVQPDQTCWIAYSQYSRSLGLFKIADAKPPAPLKVVLKYTEADIEGRVVGNDGKGLANNAVKLIFKTNDGLQYTSMEYKTDSYGYYDCDHMPSGSDVTVYAQLMDGAGSESRTSPVNLSNGIIYVSMPILIVGGEKKQPDYDRNLPNDGRATYGGQIVDEQGKPVSRVEVEVAYKPEDSMSTWIKKVRANTDGRWTVRLPLELPSMYIRLSHPNYIGFHFEPSLRQPDLASLRNQSNIMMMKRGLRIYGEVLDSQGKPVENALVCAGRLYSSSYGKIIEDPTTARTDAKGKFSIGGLPQNENSFMVTATGYAPTITTAVVQENMKPLNIEMKAGKIYRGRLVDGEGKSLEGVRVNCSHWISGRSQYNLPCITLTDSDGRFQINDLPAKGTLEFDFSKKGYWGFSRTLPDDFSKVDRLTMYTRISYSGQVFDAKTGKPVPQFDVVPGCRWKPADKDIFWSNYYAQPQNNPEAKFSIQDFGFFLHYPYQEQFYVRVIAKGYFPEVSPGFKITEPAKPMVIRLKKSEIWRGTVFTPEGKPAKNAEVGWIGPGRKAFIDNGKFSTQGFTDQAEYIVNTDSSGCFELPPSEDQGFFYVLHDTGYAKITKDQFTTSKDMVLNPWGRIEGMVRIGKQSAVECSIGLNDRRKENSSPVSENLPIQNNYRTTTDKNGHFVFDRVFPGKWSVMKGISSGRYISFTQGEPVEVKTGETSHVIIGGVGRPVIGRIVLPAGKILKIDWSEGSCSIGTRLPIPDEVEKMNLEEKQKWYQTEKGKAFLKDHKEKFRSYPFAVQNDGTFRVDDIPAGRYHLGCTVYASLPNDQCGRGEEIGYLNHEFAIPEMPDGRSDEPFDLGTLELVVEKHLKIGDVAPDFDIKTLDGKTIKLSDFKGKYVLLDFWAAWCRPCVGELPGLKKTYDRFGSDKRFVIIGLNLDRTMGDLQSFVTKNNIKWLQGYLGEWSKTNVPSSYGFRVIPAIFLIGPDGKVIGTNLQGWSVDTVIEKALSQEKR